MISINIIQQAMELKSLVGRTMSPTDLERAVRCCNGILAEAGRVAGLEQEALRPAETGDSGRVQGAAG